MSDLFQGQTMTEAFTFTTPSTAVAHTFTFNFQPDKVVFVNLTKWAAVAGNLPISVWYRDQTTAAHAYQQAVIDSAAAQSFNFIDASTLGFTVADTAGGQDSMHATISGISQTDPIVVTHSAYTFQTNQIVRFTDLGPTGLSSGVTTHGMGPLNNNRYKIVVLSPTTFSLKDVITGEPIDGTAFPVYVSGGRITLETAVISLNNPQVTPYSNLNPYDPNPYNYEPIEYKLTVSTAVLKDASNYIIEVYKWGQVTNLGTIS
jgi:hypothetical protein